MDQKLFEECVESAMQLREEVVNWDESFMAELEGAMAVPPPKGLHQCLHQLSAIRVNSKPLLTKRQGMPMALSPRRR